ncbi:hypothetical protein E4T39_06298 [Aureobasidium subglaciale]|nr:hypothetical protein E4T39_06298 [Aureobasidium subglaciale]
MPLATRDSPFNTTLKKFYTQAAQDRPEILRRNENGRFMTTEEIEQDDARMCAEELARTPSRPPVDKPQAVFPASGWPTGPTVQTPERSSEGPEAAPPIPARSPLRPRPGEQKSPAVLLWRLALPLDPTSFASVLVPASPPLEYLAPSPPPASENEGPRGVDYNPDTTGLVSMFDWSSSSSGASRAAQPSVSEVSRVVERRRTW